MNRGGLLKLDKDDLQISTVSITFNGEKFQTLPLRWDTRQGCLPFPLLNITLQVFVKIGKQE